MRRVLALASLVAFMPTANAQDKAKSDFSHNAEFRSRYFYTQNPGASKRTQGNESGIENRFKLGTSFRANEKFSATLTLLHASNMGQTSTETQGDFGTATGGQEENFLSVNEAYGTWNFSDDWNFKFGRQNFQIGDGYVMGVNDWEQQPFAFEGAVGNWEAEFGRFQLFAFKYREMGSLTGTAAATNSASADPEHNAYGVNFDLKTMPEMLKTVNVHVIKDNADAIDAATGTTVGGTQGQDTLRYGANVGLNFSIVDLKLWYAANSGDYKQIATGGAKTELDAKQHMYQAEVGVNLEGFMGSRVWFQYHQDSGDDNNADREAGTYDAYFYERHANAGMMDLFSWGNLTYMQLGWTGKPMDSTTVGLSYTRFQLTEASATSAGFTAGRMGGRLNTTGTATKDELGDEIDLWAEHNYDGGLATVLRFGYFMPGDRFDGITPAANDEIMQVMVEGKLTF